jgi:RNA-binding protein
MGTLTTSQRTKLRGLAHSLKPVVWLGKLGLSDSAVREVDAALLSHELIKVQGSGSRDERLANAQELGERLGAEVVTLIGRTVVLYRQHPDPKKRTIDVTFPG